MVTFHVVIEEVTCKNTPFWDAAANDGSGELNATTLNAAGEKLAKAISSRLPEGAGYLCKVDVANIASIPVSEYRTWAAWQRR